MCLFFCFLMHRSFNMPFKLTFAVKDISETVLWWWNTFFSLLYFDLDLCSLMILAGSSCLKKITGNKIELFLWCLSKNMEKLSLFYLKFFLFNSLTAKRWQLKHSGSNMESKGIIKNQKKHSEKYFLRFYHGYKCKIKFVSPKNSAI